MCTSTLNLMNYSALSMCSYIKTIIHRHIWVLMKMYVHDFSKHFRRTWNKNNVNLHIIHIYSADVDFAYGIVNKFIPAWKFASIYILVLLLVGYFRVIHNFTRKIKFREKRDSKSQSKNYIAVLTPKAQSQLENNCIRGKLRLEADDDKPKQDEAGNKRHTQ